MAPEKGLNLDRGDEPYGDGPYGGATLTTEERSPNDAGLGETVKAGVSRASAFGAQAAGKLRHTLARSHGGEGFEQILVGLAEFARRQPLTALLISTGVGVCVGRLLALGQAAERG